MAFISKEDEAKHKKIIRKKIRKRKPIMAVEKPREVYVLNPPNFTKYTSVNVFLILFATACIIASVVFSVSTHLQLEDVKLYKQDVILRQGQEISNLQRDLFDVQMQVHVLYFKDEKQKKGKILKVDEQLIRTFIEVQIERLTKKREKVPKH